MAKKTAVPKRLAGVKIPKPLRRGLKELAAAPDGKKTIFQALLAASAVVAAASAHPDRPPSEVGAAGEA